MLARVFSLKRLLDSGPCSQDYSSNDCCKMTKCICSIKMAWVPQKVWGNPCGAVTSALYKELSLEYCFSGPNKIIFLRLSFSSTLHKYLHKLVITRSC